MFTIVRTYDILLLYWDEETNLILGSVSNSSRHHGWLAQLVRVLAWRARGHRFESYIAHHIDY